MEEYSAVRPVLTRRSSLALFRRTERWMAGFFVAFLVLSAVPPVHAVPLKGYEAMAVSFSGRGELAMKPGETKTFSAEFLNIGTAAWKREGFGFVSIYTYDPKYRTSPFQYSSWKQPQQPAILSETSVNPGQVGHIQFTLQAPSTVGTYKETFALASEDTAWIPGGQFSVSINVSGTSGADSGAPTSVSTPSSSSSPVAPLASPSVDGYQASILLKSAKTLQVAGGEVVLYTVGVKNTGTKAWTRRTVRKPDVAIAVSGDDYTHSSWLDSRTLLAKADAPVAPGMLDFLSFQFTAPSKAGNHTVRFFLAVDDVSVPGGEIDIPIEVTSNAPSLVQEEPRASEDGVDRSDRIEEPMMRVGVLIVDEETDWKVDITCESDFELRDGEGHLLAELNEGEEAEAFYKKERYWYNRGSGLESTNSYLRFVPEEENAICTVTNFDWRKTRNGGYPDNTFRNILELRYNTVKDRTWLINELPIELYLRGLAETSNISHINFQKTLITAARTYALYHWERATKHASEYFLVDAYADQVYKGYGQEQRTPNLTRAVQETEGVVVMYDSKVAITPYFSRSDGRTRDWSEVWYGDVAWLKSVPTPCDQGKTLWGHGVGMSASEALCRANKGEDWDDILTYFYTGVNLVERW